MPAPFAASHFTGRCWPSDTPEASGPRNDGQFCADAMRAIKKTRFRIACVVYHAGHYCGRPGFSSRNAVSDAVTGLKRETPTFPHALWMASICHAGASA